MSPERSRRLRRTIVVTGLTAIVTASLIGGPGRAEHHMGEPIKVGPTAEQVQEATEGLDLSDLEYERDTSNECWSVEMCDFVVGVK